MEMYHNTVQDKAGNIINGAVITVKLASDNSIATIYDKDGSALSNPFVSGYDRSKGETDFKAANELYNVEVVNGTTTTIESISLIDPNTFSTGMTSADRIKLDNIESSADVTDAANVTAAGASITNMILDNSNLVVVPETNLQSWVDGVDSALFKARGTGVTSTYVNTAGAGGTTFVHGAVAGEISSDEGYASFSYAGATGITVNDLTASSTYVYIDRNGNLGQQKTIPTRQDKTRKAFTMRIGVNTVAETIIGFEYFNNPIGHYTNSMRDLYEYLVIQGVPFKKDQIITGRSSDLGFDVSAGSLLEFGGTGDIYNPNIKNFSSVTNATFFLSTRTAFDSGTNTDLPKLWDNNGTLTILGSTTLVAHRLYRFSNGNICLQYGQANYANMTLAKAGAPLEQYVLNPGLKNATFFGWWFIELSASNTSGTTLTDFVEYTLGIQGGSSSGLSGAALRANNCSDFLDYDAVRINIGLNTALDKRYSPIFSNVAAMSSASPVSTDGLSVVFTLGMTITTTGYYSPGDGGGADYLVVAPQSYDGLGDHELGDNKIAVLQAEQYTPEAFGANGTRSTDSAALRAILARNEIVWLGNKRYYYDSTTITNAKVRIYGQGMPQVNSGKTALENGSIIDGSFPFTSSDADFRDFGVDNGSASDSAEGDALRTTASINAGGHLHTENIVGLCKSASASHALLFQSHSSHSGNNLLGVYGLFGFVSKCQNVNLGLVQSIDNDESGVLLKSDTSFGRCRNVYIERVVAESSVSQKRGFHIQSSNDSLNNVQVGSIMADGCIDNVLIQLGSSGPEMRNVQIGEILSKNAISRDLLIDTTSSTGIIYDVSVNSIITEGTLLNGFMALGNGQIRDINIVHAFINHAAGATDSQLENSCFIGASVSRSNIGHLSIFRNFNPAFLGGILYSNASTGSNTLGARYAKVYGAGALDTGYIASSISGSDQTIIITFNRSGDPITYISATPANATGDSVNTFDNEYIGITGYAASPFRRGQVLTIKNDSSNALTIKHNVGGKIRTSGETNKLIANFDTLSFVWSGEFWSQI
jgi:hypothetical protein